MKKQLMIKLQIVLLAFCFMCVSCDVQNNKYYKIYKNEQLSVETNNLVLYGEREVVGKIKDKVSDIYTEITQMFNHTSKVFERNNNKLAIYIVDASKYPTIYPDKKPRACYQQSIGLIFPYTNSTSVKESTIRHEMIHAVTTGSPDYCCKNTPLWFNEGVAQALQQNRNYILELQKINSSKITNTDFSTEELWQTDVPLKYSQAAAFVQFLFTQYSFDSIAKIFYTDDDFFNALENVTHGSFEKTKANFLLYLENNNGN